MEGILKYEQENNNSDNDNENNNNSKRLTSTLNNQKEGAYSITASNNNINCTQSGAEWRNGRTSVNTCCSYLYPIPYTGCLDGVHYSIYKIVQ